MRPGSAVTFSTSIRSKENSSKLPSELKSRSMEPAGRLPSSSGREHVPVEQPAAFSWMIRAIPKSVPGATLPPDQPEPRSRSRSAVPERFVSKPIPRSGPPPMFVVRIVTPREASMTSPCSNSEKSRSSAEAGRAMPTRATAKGQGGEGLQQHGSVLVEVESESLSSV